MPVDKRDSQGATCDLSYVEENVCDRDDGLLSWRYWNRDGAVRKEWL
jgi:hypothetical protein